MSEGGGDTRELELSGPIDLRSTFFPHRMGSYDPTLRIEARELWHATPTPDGAASLHVAVEQGTRVRAEAWGPGASYVLERLPAFLGEHEDAGAFAPEDPRVRRLARLHRGLRVVRLPRIWPTLLENVLLQRVSWKDAARSYARLVREHGSPAPGVEGLWLPPEPSALARLPSHTFREAGVDGRRAATIQRAAISASSIERLGALPPIEAGAKLSTIPGLGPWTVQRTLGLAFGDTDAVLLGDLHLPHHVAQVLAGEDAGTDERMIELLEPFRGHRWRVIRLVQSAAMVRAPSQYG